MKIYLFKIIIIIFFKSPNFNCIIVFFIIILHLSTSLQKILINLTNFIMLLLNFTSKLGFITLIYFPETQEVSNL